MGDSRKDGDRDDDRFVRWQDITRRSLDFVNNVLIVLTSGLIAVVLNEAADAATVSHLRRWQLVCAGTAVILLGLSVLSGVVAAANRLQSIRLTTRRMRIEDLYNSVINAEREAVTGAYYSADGAFLAAKHAFEAAKTAWTKAQANVDATRAGESADQAQSDANLAGDRASQASGQQPPQVTEQARQAAESATNAALKAREAAGKATEAAGQTQQPGAQADAAAAEALRTAKVALQAADQADRDAERANRTADRPDRIAAMTQTGTRPVSKTDGSADWDEDALVRLIKNLTGWENLTRPAIQTAAKACLGEHDRGVVREQATITHLQMIIRQWSDIADSHTWWLIRVQLWLFMLGSIFFAVVPIWIFFTAR